MICRDARSRIQALLDGELDVVHQAEVEDHLQDCQSCARAYESLRALHERVSDPDLYFRAPAALRSRIRRTAPARPERRLSWSAWPIVTAAAAALVLVASAAWMLEARRSAQALVAQEIVAAHVRSLLPGHLTDVPSSDQHNVKPWFAGKTDFSPPVPDLQSHGFTLAGGRLDYLGSRTVAVLVYKRRQHVLNLFVWPSDANLDVPSTTLHGYNVLYWTQGHVAFAVVSDLNSAELAQFAELIRQAVRTAS